MRHAYCRLQKEPILEQFHVISNGVRVEDLKAIANLHTVYICKRLPRRHHVNSSEQMLPYEPLIID